MAQFDIFRTGAQGPLWLGVCLSFDDARRRIETLDAGNYLIFDAQNQRKTEVRIEASNGARNGTGDFQSLLIDAMRIVNADLGTLQIYCAASGTLELISQVGFNEAFVNHFRSVTTGDAACGTALARGKRVIVDDVASDPIYNAESRQVMLANGSRSLQSIPLLNSENKLVGMLSPQYKTAQTPIELHNKLSDDLARTFGERIAARL